jgi:hypothetical protein
VHAAVTETGRSTAATAQCRSIRGRDGQTGGAGPQLATRPSGSTMTSPTWSSGPIEVAKHPPSPTVARLHVGLAVVQARDVRDCFATRGAAGPGRRRHRLEPDGAMVAARGLRARSLSESRAAGRRHVGCGRGRANGVSVTAGEPAVRIQRLAGRPLTNDAATRAASHRTAHGSRNVINRARASHVSGHSPPAHGAQHESDERAPCDS